MSDKPLTDVTFSSFDLHPALIAGLEAAGFTRCTPIQAMTLPIALAGLQGQYTTEWDIIMAGSVVSILPMLALYIFAQKYVIQGVASSGIK